MTLREVLLREWEIVKTAKEGVGDSWPLVAHPRPANPKLDDEQRQALDALLTSINLVSVFRGGAGTDKSFVLHELAEQLRESGRRLVVLAPQRQQVVEMEKAGFPSPSTIANFILKRELAERAVVVVDEAGQISGRQMLELMRLVRERNARLILSGDTRQHGAVEASDALPWGSFAISGACLAWALDNNLTRKVSAGDPVQIAMLKGLVVGSVNTVLAFALGAKLPAVSALLATGVVGFVGYGVSLTLFVLALRHIGTARTGAYFSIAPFVGAVIAILFLGEVLTISFGIASVLMGLGVWLHLTERHKHAHRHEPMEHEHLHSHDAHHQHVHAPTDPPGEPHSHGHRHEELVHSHPHFPDIHHRHGH